MPDDMSDSTPDGIDRLTMQDRLSENMSDRISFGGGHSKEVM